MATWTQTFSVNNKYSLTLECTEQSYSIPNNTSVVAWKLTMATAAYSYTGYADYRTTVSISINGTTVYSYNASRDFNPTAAASYSEVLASGTATVAHNSDGTKTCACAASVTVASGPYSPGSASISQNLTLTTIPRASSASWSGDFTIGVDKVITITSASTSFRHEFTFTVGSGTTSASVAAGTNSYTWRPNSTTFAAQFPTQTSRTGTMVLKTYNGATLIGSVSYSFTLKIPDSWKPSTPSITLSPVNANAWLSGKGIYVAGYTQTRVRATSTASAGTTISSWTVSGAASMTQSGASLDKTSGVIASSGSKSFTVTVTDARGRTASTSASASYLSYSTPAVTSLTVTRGTYSGGVWTQSDNGTDLKAVFKAACSLYDEGNEMAWTIGAPFSVSGSALASGGTITEYATGVGTATAYTPTVTVTDELGNTGTKSVQVPTVEMPFVINVTKPAVGVGGVPQTPRTLELASNWQLNVGAGTVLPVTNDVLADALAMTAYTTKAFRGSGANYTGTLPGGSTDWAYGSFIVLKRNATYHQVIAVNNNSEIAVNSCNNGSTWIGWRRQPQTVVKTASVSVAAGTIGTRGALYQWNASAIGGTPLFAMVTAYGSSSNANLTVLIDSDIVYLAVYRAVSTAFTQNVSVTIWYE